MSIHGNLFSRKSLGFFCAMFSSFSVVQTASAWSWQLEIVNNWDVPLHYKFNQHNSGNAWGDNGSKNEGDVTANNSVRFTLTTGGTFNKTTDGELTLSNSENLFCRVRYYQASIYKAHNLGKWHLTGQDNSPQCESLFLSSTEASDDGWNPVDLVFNAVRFPRLTRGQTQCSGFDNCVVVNPYKYNTDWAVQNIHLQNHIADNEALNVGQMLGTHNSVISRGYTSSGMMTNMSYSDPNHYLNITEQLNLGMRQFEYDFVHEGNQFKICHFKSDDSMLSDISALFVCHGNASLASAFNEIGQWIIAHPNELVLIYFDNSESWNSGKLTDFETILRQTLHDKVLTKSDIGTDALDVSHLTKKDVIKKFNKNLILYAHNHDAIFSGSDYIFKNVVGNPSAQLHDDHNISDFSAFKMNCPENKRCVTDSLYSSDSSYMSLRVVREDRTHLQQQKGSHQDTSVYLTNDKLKDAVRYPVNAFVFDKLSLDDGRLLSAIWSFKFPYPLEQDMGGSHIAFIDHVSGKFSNKTLTNNFFGVLCYHPYSHQWKVVENVFTRNNFENSESFHNTAQNACGPLEGFRFATPVSGYQLDEVIKFGLIKGPTLINYTRNNDGEWIANNNEVLNFLAQ